MSEEIDYTIKWWERIWWKIEKIWETPGDWYRATKWFIQRGRRGYADCDTWSLDGYLTSWLPEALLQLRTNLHGHPIGMTQAGWESRLDKMILGFRAGRVLGELEYDWKDKKVAKKLDKDYRQGLKLFIEHFDNLWD